ncbi:MAG: hypothetical protein ACI4DK_16790, partial [Lachnospiraceae bacterium]
PSENRTPRTVILIKLLQKSKLLSSYTYPSLPSVYSRAGKQCKKNAVISCPAIAFMVIPWQAVKYNKETVKNSLSYFKL